MLLFLLYFSSDTKTYILNSRVQYKTVLSFKPPECLIDFTGNVYLFILYTNIPKMIVCGNQEHATDSVLRAYVVFYSENSLNWKSILLLLIL